MGKVQYLFIILSSTTIYLNVTPVNSDLVSKKFTKSEICHLQDRIDNGCAQVEPRAKSLLECTTSCRQNCAGIFWPDSLICYHARPCTVSFPTCTTSDIKTSFYSEKLVPCKNDGVYNISRNACQCVDGWVGDYCERLPKTCSELRDYGYPTGWSGGDHFINLKLDIYPTPIHVLCQIWDEFDNTVIMSNTGLYSNNKTWYQYENGYVYDDKNFFVGLNKMKALNDAGLNRLSLQVTFTDGQGEFNQFNIFYMDFEMADSTSGFSFTFSNVYIYEDGPLTSIYSIGDCLGPVKGGKFSTFDKDQDGNVEQNCAAVTGVGWWYKNDCNMVCNPLGRNYVQQPGLETPSHFKMDGIDLEGETYTYLKIYMHYYRPL